MSLHYLHIAIYISINLLNNQVVVGGQVRRSLLSFLQMRKPRFRKSIYFTWLALDTRPSVIVTLLFFPTYFPTSSRLSLGLRNLLSTFAVGKKAFNSQNTMRNVIYSRFTCEIHRTQVTESSMLSYKTVKAEFELRSFWSRSPCLLYTVVH